MDVAQRRYNMVQNSTQLEMVGKVRAEHLLHYLYILVSLAINMVSCSY